MYLGTDSARLRELRQALAGWLDVGGFLPDWHATPAASLDFLSWCVQYRPAIYVGRQLDSVRAALQQQVRDAAVAHRWGF